MVGTHTGAGSNTGGPGIFLRGLLMGAADIVPGVSGGTVAFITGIYDRLLTAIAAFDLELLRILRRDGLRPGWQHIDGGFLALLVAGILTSVFTLARGISYLLETYPLLVWSSFFGLILGSALYLLRQTGAWNPPVVAGVASGTAAAATIALAPALTLSASPLTFFLSGMVAICAMILPGVSGSFILVLLGMYTPVLTAIHELQLGLLLVFALGAGLGLLVFTRLLHWLLSRYGDVTLATLTGFLLGSLPGVWPWRLANGAADAVLVPVWPGSYAANAGSPQLFACSVLALLGFAAVWLLESRWGP